MMDAITLKSHAKRSRDTSVRGGTERTTLDEHKREVARIAARVRNFYERREKFRIFHNSTNSTRSQRDRDPGKIVDTSRLNHVVRVDTGAQTALVEVNVPMDRLVEETLKYGLVPPVVMEFPGITAGGGYSGTSGESSSFKHGFFDRTLNEVEIVLPNGEVVVASAKNEYSDLFRGAAGAMGTLGVTTMVEIQLREASRFVETTYHPVSGMDEAIEKLLEFASRPDDFDYIDGIMFSKTNGAIITGRMTNTLEDGLIVQRFSDAKDPWFYLHVKDRISKHSGPVSEAIPLPDYFFRYDRGGFWVGEEPFNYFSGVPFNRFTRWFLDDFLHTRMLYKALHASGKFEQMLIQDLALPCDNAAEFVTLMDDLFNIWPLWLCPLKQSHHPTMHPHLNEYEADGKTLKPMLNIGLWGKAPPTHGGYIRANREIERTLRELRGMKWLYAQTYSPESEFWSDFDKPWYESLRSKYHAKTLPTVYEKVKVDIDAEDNARENRTWQQIFLDMWPVSGLYGLKKAIDSGDYLQARHSAWKEWVPKDVK